MILKSNRLKRSIPESLKHEYTIFPVSRPSNPPSPPPPSHLLQCWDLECAESQAHTNSYTTFACHNSIERRPTLIRGKGICLHVYHILKLQNRISVLNVLLVFKITLFKHNLIFGKTKQYAIRQRKPQN